MTWKRRGQNSTSPHSRRKSQVKALRCGKRPLSLLSKAETVWGAKSEMILYSNKQNSHFVKKSLFHVGFFFKKQVSGFLLV